MTYRLLQVGEVLRTGDEYRDLHTGKWHPTTCAGRKVGIPDTTSQEYRRPVEVAIDRRPGGVGYTVET